MKNSTKNVVVFLISVLMLAAAGCGPEAAPVPIEIKTENPVQAAPTLSPTRSPSFKPVSLAWFYHSPAEGTDPQVLADYFDIFISSHGMESGRDLLRSLGSKAKFLRYVVFSEVIQADSCEEEPYSSQAANRPGDYCTIDRLYPDWFLKSADGQRIHDKEPYENNWFMDASHPGWREFWLERMESRESAGWDGMFIDNVEARPRYSAQALLNYPDLASFQQANVEFLKLIYENFHPKGMLIFANVLYADTTPEWEMFLPYLDGAMIENFAVDWESGEFLPVETWEAQMQNVLTAQARDKEVILVAQGDVGDTSRQVFALASYLLVNNGKAYFRYTDGEYDKLQMYSNYLDDPGAPLGDRYYDNGRWIREFEKGKVTVNPESHQASIDFNP